MTNSENFEHMVDESTVSFWPTALRYGVLGGLFLVIYALVANMTGFSIPTSITSGLIQTVISLLFIVVIGTLTVKQHRNVDLKGNISFLRAFLVAFIALFVASIISSLFNVLYMTVIDPTYTDTAMEKMEELFTNMGMDESMMETQLEATRAHFNTTSMIKNGLLWGSFFNAVVAAIIGAIMKRKPAVV